LWQQLVWNISFAQQLLAGCIFLVLGVVAAIILIPLILRHLQAERDKQLAKALLKEWGGDCIAAMMRLRPPGAPMIEIEGYSHTTASGGFGSDLPVFLFWIDIREGKREPGGAAQVIYEAFGEGLYSDEERAMTGVAPDKMYPFCSGDPEVPRAMIKRILNPMYAKLEIFKLDQLPINELEMAMSYLDAFSQRGHINRYGLSSYALHLAQSMEKFAKYLWGLENWSQNTSWISRLRARR